MPYSVLQLAGKYIKYRLQAKNGKGHGMHSPFVFEFIQKVLADATTYPAYDSVEKLRKELLTDKRIIEVLDLGAGSGKTASNSRSIASIAKNAAKPPKFGQLIYRMVNFYKPETIVELGTSLGITSCYLQLGNEEAKLITLEGAPEIAAEARTNFTKMGLGKIEQVVGNFDNTLTGVLQQLKKVDFVFIDGNHQLEPTVRYFNQILPFTDNDSILIFDDIHWSAEMEQAWQQIQQHERCSCTIDLFFIGIVFLRKEFKEPIHFQVEFA